MPKRFVSGSRWRNLTAALIWAGFLAGNGSLRGEEVLVKDLAELRQAIRGARAGTTIQIAPGTYPGGLSIQGIQGEPGRPIVIRAQDPNRLPEFRGGTSGIQLSVVAHLELHDLSVSGASGNGINLDDGGNHDTPSHHVLLRGLRIRDVGPRGNRDGLKLSGLNDFRVENCLIERWGSGGSGIDMVGCHRGEIVDCVFRHGDETGSNGVQAKGGSRDVAIRRCHFDHAGQRAVNLGGSTGADYFRPDDATSEAAALTVEDCAFVGSMAAVAFVGVDGAVVRRNTIYRPRRWAFRILQENQRPDLVPCRGGRFERNLIVFRSDEMTVPVNVGPGTEAASFRLEGNQWYCLDSPRRSRPNLAIPEIGGIHGQAPVLRDPERGDLRPGPNAPSDQAGARIETVADPR